MPRILKFKTPAGSIQPLTPISTTMQLPTTLQAPAISMSLAGNYQLGQLANSDINKITHEEPKISGGVAGKKFATGAANNAMSLAGSVASMANNAIFQNSRYASDPQAQEQANVRTGISDAMMKSGNPYVMAAGLATKIVDGALDATGMRSDNISKKAAKKAGIPGAARFANNLMNYLPGNPMAMGGKAISDSEKSMDAEKVRGAFAGTLDDLDTAETMGGSRVNFMLGGARAKMEKYVQQQNQRNELLTSISRTNTLRKQNDYAQELEKRNEDRFNGNALQNMTVGKTGLKLPDRATLDAIYALRKPISEFKEGGVIGVDSNVIQEGTLHKELNHMEEHNKELDKVITDKGIAVVTTDKEGNVEQIAEIEKEEIVFRLELTKKIEELWHKGTPEAMLKAGKILVKEIMGNTDDNTEEILDGNN